MAPQVNTSRGRACSVVRCTTVAMTLSCHLCRSSEYFPWKEWSRVALSPSWSVQEFQREFVEFVDYFSQNLENQNQIGKKFYLRGFASTASTPWSLVMELFSTRNPRVVFQLRRLFFRPMQERNSDVSIWTNKISIFLGSIGNLLTFRDQTTCKKHKEYWTAVATCLANQTSLILLFVFH